MFQTSFTPSIYTELYLMIRCKWLWVLCVLAMANVDIRAQEVDTVRFAKYNYMLMDRQEDLMVNSVYLQMPPSKRVHTGIRPYRYEMFDRMAWDSLEFDWSAAPFRRFPIEPDKAEEYALLHKTYNGTSKLWSWVHRKLFNESFITLTEESVIKTPESYNITINPIAFFEMAPGDGDIPYYYMNGRGVWINGNFGKFSFYTMVGENQGRFPQLYNEFYADAKFAHGWGWRRGFKDRGHDFAMAMGEVNYTPNNYFSFTLGHGKHFWGEGYRSLFLSDFSMPFPFFKIETTLGPVKYINLWAIHADASDARGLDVFPNKYTAMHLLSWNITPRWNFQFFEANVWSQDTIGTATGFNVHFLNPVIFYRTIEYQAGFGGGNALAGLASSYRIGNGLKVYGQFIVDDFKLDALRAWRDGHWLNLFGVQAGAMYGNYMRDVNYTIGLEWNRVRPFVYSHRSRASNYEHLNYPIAHPWGSGFQELIFHGQARYKRWVTEWVFSAGVAGRDTAGINLGNDIRRSYLDRPLGNLGYQMPTGNPVTIVNAQWSIGYMVNISTGMRLEAGFRIRRERFRNPTDEEALPFDWFFVGLRTPFFNRYYDM